MNNSNFVACARSVTHWGMFLIDASLTREVFLRNSFVDLEILFDS